ncbi:MAG: hypothetical protein MI810_17670 [Flavobacteriales bacterium]|nr:hypothetical protein [Flavobacteriales bacterium]
MKLITGTYKGQTVLLLIFLLGSFLGRAQFKGMFRHFKEEKVVTYGLNNRKTRFLNDPSTLYGGYIGIKYGNRLKHVITLNSTVFWVGNELDNTNLTTEVQLNFAGLSEEYVYWKTPKWNFATYLHFGAGKARFRSWNQPSNPSFSSRWVFPAELGLHSEFALNSWLGIRGGVGYRYVFNSSEWPLHGFYYKIGAGLNTQEFLVWLKDMKKFYKDISRRRYTLY